MPFSLHVDLTCATADSRAWGQPSADHLRRGARWVVPVGIRVALLIQTAKLVDRSWLGNRVPDMHHSVVMPITNVATGGTMNALGLATVQPENRWVNPVEHFVEGNRPG